MKRAAVIAMRDVLATSASALRRVRPALLLLVMVTAIVAAMLVPPWPVGALLGCLPCCSLLRSREGRARLARRASAMAPLVVVVVAARVVCAHGTASASVLAIATNRDALVAGGVTALRIGVAALWSTWLALSLRASEIDRGLTDLGVPTAFVELVALTRRFAAQLAASLRAAWSAAALRGGLLSARALGRTVGLLAGIVLVRAIDRSHRVAIARALRGEAQP